MTALSPMLRDLTDSAPILPLSEVMVPVTSRSAVMLLAAISVAVMVPPRSGWR